MMVDERAGGSGPPTNEPTAYDAYDAGDFKRGDRVMVVTDETRHKGAFGWVLRVVPTEIYPVSVWLDVFGPPTPTEFNEGMGLPMCASEIGRWE